MIMMEEGLDGLNVVSDSSENDIDDEPDLSELYKFRKTIFSHALFGITSVDGRVFKLMNQTGTFTKHGKVNNFRVLDVNDCKDIITFFTGQKLMIAKMAYQSRQKTIYYFAEDNFLHAIVLNTNKFETPIIVSKEIPDIKQFKITSNNEMYGLNLNGMLFHFNDNKNLITIDTQEPNYTSFISNDYIMRNDGQIMDLIGKQPFSLMNHKRSTLIDCWKTSVQYECIDSNWTIFGEKTLSPLLHSSFAVPLISIYGIHRNIIPKNEKREEYIETSTTSLPLSNNEIPETKNETEIDRSSFNITKSEAPWKTSEETEFEEIEKPERMSKTSLICAIVVPIVAIIIIVAILIKKCWR
ncbi:hypothetical protein SNEBB_006382 [Seison nebaliae]|nr:hypothetical protein SNEBB_006382 [Seison nebaliae]